jgi:cytochrome c-type biogenesis protein
MGFAAAWSPCIGPILGTILIYAGSNASTPYGIALLAVYSLGLAVPFILSTLAINILLTFIKRMQGFIRFMMITSGLVLIAFGIILLSNSLGWFAGFFPDVGIKI